MIRMCINCLKHSLDCNSTLVVEFNRESDRDDFFDHVKSKGDYNLRKDYIIRGFFKNTIVYLLEIRRK